MARENVERYRRWFGYERDVHDKVLASFDTIPADRRGGAEYRKAVGLFGHLVAARRIWLFRLGGVPTPPATIFPDDPDPGRVAAEWREVAGLWDDYLARVDDAELAREFEYTSLDAGRFRNRVEDILTQLFGHSWYHRGQIAVLVRAAGGQPAITDFVYWCREAIR